MRKIGRLLFANMQFDNVLYIIGNGFDLHHRIPSAYQDFGKWMKKNDSDTYYIYSAVCRYAQKWSDFETSMAYVSRDYLLASGEMFQPDPKKSHDEWLMADILLGGDAARGTADNLLEHLKKDLHKWICSLRVSEAYNTYKLPIDYYARFLVFNYTTFLETQYGIEKERINYIHGKKTLPWGNIVVGHGEDNEAIFQRWWSSNRFKKHDFAYRCYQGDTRYLPEYEMVTDAVESYYIDAQKKTADIIRSNTDYFQSLSTIRYIYVWGFSFAKVDMPYIEKVYRVNSSPERIKWYVSYYNDDEMNKFRQRLMAIGVQPENIVFEKLMDIVL